MFEVHIDFQMIFLKKKSHIFVKLCECYLMVYIILHVVYK